MLIFSIYFASSNKVSLSSNAIQILWSCACVNSDTCPLSILLLLSSSHFSFHSLSLSLSLSLWTRIHEHDDSFYLFSFCFRGMTSFCKIDHDGQWLMSCTCMIKVRNAHSVTCEAMSLNKLKMYKIAMWNHRNYSHMYRCVIGGIWAQGSCHDFCFHNKYVQVLELEQAWLWIKVSWESIGKRFDDPNKVKFQRHVNTCMKNKT